MVGGPPAQTYLHFVYFLWRLQPRQDGSNLIQSMQFFTQKITLLLFQFLKLYTSKSNASKKVKEQTPFHKTQVITLSFVCSFFSFTIESFFSKQ